MTQHVDLDGLLEFALDATFQAGRLTLGYFLRGIEVERKSDSSPVTAADRGAEQLLRAAIRARFPADGVLGEEYGHESGSSGLTWIIDPIDGTKSFTHGVPIYGCLLALVNEAHEPLVGVAHFPALNETVYARKGGGAFWNGRRARVSSVSKLADAVALCSDLNNWGERADSWERIVQATTFQRTWGDSYGYALVATGRAEIMIDGWMAIWDSAAFGVILPEAGGTFTDWQGASRIDGGEGFATNGALYEAARALITPR
ncbi:MAG: histidinol phosphate phosphatase [Anaerolineae bacterium]|nr:histidinol phosphate phosphatase [Anaerolineae bacterium]NUQ02892.1 histidinol phosphate phosphatase [Anaerolineae bacterium]